MDAPVGPMRWSNRSTTVPKDWIRTPMLYGLLRNTSEIFNFEVVELGLKFFKQKKCRSIELIVFVYLRLQPLKFAIGTKAL